jgi:hypothetical protein
MRHRQLHGDARKFRSLEQARARFYDTQRFADVFAQLERAPQNVAADLESLPGVARIDTRIVEPAMLPLEDLPELLRGTAVSLPLETGGALNAIHLRDGRLPEADHADEAILLQAFAVAYHIRPGERLPVVLNGKLRQLVIVGIASSPEYVMAIAPGSLSSDPERFAVVWMSHDALAAAFRMGRVQRRRAGAAPGGLASRHHRRGRSSAPTVGRARRVRPRPPAVQPHARRRAEAAVEHGDELSRLAGKGIGPVALGDGQECSDATADRTAAEEGVCLVERNARARRRDERIAHQVKNECGHDRRHDTKPSNSRRSARRYSAIAIATGMT